MIMLSLIIPTLNSSRRLGPLLEAAEAQTLPPDEIIVVDSSSDDDTAAVARGRGARVIEIPRKDFDHGGTRSMAASAASGDFLIYMTDDAVPADRDAFFRLISAFGDKAVGAAYGRQLPHPGSDVFGRALRFFNYPAEPCVRNYADRVKFGIKTPFLSNSFAAYRRNALLRVGSFKPDLLLGEDTYAGGKLLLAGYSIAYVPGSVVFHSHDYSPWQEFKRYFDIGVFHRRESWILDSFGKAEGEGVRFVRAALKFLKSNSAGGRIPEFFFRTILKYIGYKAGYVHELLPARVRRMLSMHPGWWGN